RSEADPPPRHVRQGPRAEHRDSTCTHICSRRGIVLICAVLTNALVLICVVAAWMVTSGMSARGGMTSYDINTDFNLQGTELQQVRDLDMQYSQMRAPAIYGGITFSLTFGVVSVLFVVIGNKPAHMMPLRILVGALVFQAVGAVMYVVAVGLYLHFIIGVNATDVCKQRERLYMRNGYTWMTCNVGGGDAAVALFGLITAILYIAGTVITFQTIRYVKQYVEQRKRREAGRELARSEQQRAPMRAETITV
uniref:MARVEL domain-containing protein n=2 Tax=Monopterus albus TaxID=43700 RepID=A0A3Q3IBE9_MONAL